VSGRRSSLSRAALLGVVVLLVASCAPLPPPRTPIPPEADRFIDLLRERWQQFDDLRSLAEITIRRDGSVQRLTGVLLLRAPASLRFEALTPWGQPFLLLAGNADTVTLYEVAENRALVGPASARATERWLGFALEPDELVGLLAGHVLPLRDPYSAELLPTDGVGPSLKLTGAGGTQRIWADPETGVVRQVEIDSGRQRARIAYSGGGLGEPPAALTLTALDAPLTVSIRYRDPKFGVGLAASLFTLTLPEGAKIQRFR
jgi:outer membrane lipoprotein-sorting protein